MLVLKSGTIAIFFVIKQKQSITIGETTRVFAFFVLVDVFGGPFSTGSSALPHQQFSLSIHPTARKQPSAALPSTDSQLETKLELSLYFHLHRTSMSHLCTSSQITIHSSTIPPLFLTNKYLQNGKSLPLFTPAESALWHDSGCPSIGLVRAVWQLARGTGTYSTMVTSDEAELELQSRLRGTTRLRQRHRHHFRSRRRLLEHIKRVPHARTRTRLPSIVAIARRKTEAAKKTGGGLTFLEPLLFWYIQRYTNTLLGI